MRSTGIVRRIDDLGRIVIPVEIRRALKLHEDALIEFYADKNNGGSVIFKKYSPGENLSENVSDINNIILSILEDGGLTTDNERIFRNYFKAFKQFENFIAAYEKENF